MVSADLEINKKSTQILSPTHTPRMNMKFSILILSSPVVEMFFLLLQNSKRYDTTDNHLETK